MRQCHVLIIVSRTIKNQGKDASGFLGKAQIVEPNESRCPVEVFNLPKGECQVLVSGYGSELCGMMIDHWQALEAPQVKLSNLSFTRQLLLHAQKLVDCEEKIEALRTAKKDTKAQIKVLVERWAGQ